MPSRSSTSRRMMLACLSLVAALAFSAAPASAASPIGSTEQLGQMLVKDATTATKLSQPFLSFGDARWYEMVPGGDFTAPEAAGWHFLRGAGVVGETHDGAALDVGFGEIAISPAMEIDMSYPTARMFVRSLRAGSADVFVASANAGHGLVVRRAGEVAGAGADWTLSEDIDIWPSDARGDGGMRKVVFVLAGGSRFGSVHLDDFYVDPRMSR